MRLPCGHVSGCPSCSIEAVEHGHRHAMGQRLRLEVGRCPVEAEHVGQPSLDDAMPAHDRRGSLRAGVGELDGAIAGDPDSPSRARRCSETVTVGALTPEPLRQASGTRDLALVLDVVDRLEVALGGLRALCGANPQCSYARKLRALRQGGIDVEAWRVRTVDPARRCQPAARDHRGVVRAEIEGRDHDAEPAEASRDRVAQRPVGGDAADHRDRARAASIGCRRETRHQLIDRGSLEARGKVGDHLRVAGAHRPASATRVRGREPGSGPRS